MRVETGGNRGARKLRVYIPTPVSRETLSTSLESIAAAVAAEECVSIMAMQGKGKTRHLVDARQEFAIRASKLQFTQEEIGQFLNRDRSSISHLLNERVKR